MPRRRPPRPGALTDLSPVRIAKQILLLQLAFYSAAGVLLTFTALVAGKPAGLLGRLLGWEYLRGDTAEGWMFGVGWLGAGVACVIALLLLIARSKLVLDFALTIHTLHLLATALYSRAVPRHVFWWLLQAASAALMTGLGVWSCRLRELRPIAFGGRAAGGGENEEEAEAEAEGRGQRDARAGAGRGVGGFLGWAGKGGGKAADAVGARVYEMVPLKDGVGDRAG